MLVRIIKPCPKVPTVVQMAVVYEQDGVAVVDFAGEAEPVEDGKLEVMKDGAKVGEQPSFREPTDEELLARHPDALYVAKMDKGAAVELKKPEGFAFKHQFAGWESE